MVQAPCRFQSLKTDRIGPIICLCRILGMIKRTFVTHHRARLEEFPFPNLTVKVQAYVRISQWNAIRLAGASLRKCSVECHLLCRCRLNSGELRAWSLFHGACRTLGAIGPAASRHRHLALPI